MLDSTQPVYTLARLLEAYSIVGLDIARCKKEAEEKRIKNTYRDDFNIREESKKVNYRIFGQVDDDAFLGDTEYQPGSESRKRLKQVDDQVKAKSNKRRSVYDTDSTPKRPKKRGKYGPKRNLEALPGSPNEPFLTLNLPSPSSKKTLGDLATKHNTHLNKFLDQEEIVNQQACGGHNAVDKNQTDLTPLRALRNGKVRDDTTRKKRDREEEETAEENLDTLKDCKGKTAIRPHKRRCLDEELAAADVETVFFGRKVPEDENDLDECLFEPYIESPTRVEHLPPKPLFSTGSSLSKPPAAASPWFLSRRSIDASQQSKPTKNLATLGKTIETAICLDSDEDDNLVTPSFVKAVEPPRFIAHSDSSLPGPSNYQKSACAADNNDLIINEDDKKERNSSSRSANQDDAGEISTIDTCFAHPINFKCTVRCDFCADYRFGVFGYTARKTTVASPSPSPSSSLILPSKSPTYTELGNGHATIWPTTSMCIICATKRLQIIRCSCHKFSKYCYQPRTNNITNTNKNTTDEAHKVQIQDYTLHLRRWTRVVTKPDAPSALKGERCPRPPSFEPCHLCSDPAAWACISTRYYDQFLNPVKEAPIRGCGLLLCQRCKEGVEMLGGQISDAKAVMMAVTVGGKRNVTIRADYGFLFRDGLLCRAYNLRK